MGSASGAAYRYYRAPANVRPGLLLIGVVFALLGSATVAVALNPSPPANHTDSQTLTWSWTVASGTPFRSPGLWGLNGSLVLTWSSDVPVNVSLGQSANCTGIQPCNPTIVARWVYADGGQWNTTVAKYPYSLIISESTGTRADVSCVEVSTAAASPADPMSVGTLAALLAAGATLVVLGVVAVFLGLYLRGNVYGRSREVDPRDPGSRTPPRERPPSGS